MTDETRRGFIKSGSAAIAGLGILGSAETAAATQPITIYANDATEVGEAAFVTGSADSLGNWGTAYKMYPQDSYWKYEADLPVGTEFKIVKDEWTDRTAVSTEGVIWEVGSNHVVQDGQTIANLYPEF